MRMATHFFVLLTAISLAQRCYGDTTPAGKQAEELNKLRKQVVRQGKQLEEQQRQIDALKSQAGKNPASLDNRGGQDQPAQSQNQAPAPEPARKEKKTPGKQAAQAQAQAPAQPVGRPPEKKPVKKEYEEIEAIFRQQGVLTPKNTLIIEPSFQYVYSSSTRVVINGYTILPAITIGLIDVRSVNRNTYIPALSLRYGITNRLELNAYAPYVFRDDSAAIPVEVSGSTIPEQRVFNADGNHIGDVQFGLRYQFNMPPGGGPIFIGGLLAKADTGKDPFHVATTDFAGQQVETELPTGTGFWALQPSLSVIVPSDPVVFFGSVNYLYNFSSNQPVGTTAEGTTVTAKVEPGDTFGFNFGMGFAMNEKTSFSVGYEHYIIGKTKVAGQFPPAAQTTTLGSLLFGASYKLGTNVNLNFSLQAGITEAAPDVQLTLRVPFSI